MRCNLIGGRLALGGLLLALLAPVLAQDAKGIYSCTDDKGRRHTADRPIPECVAREQRLLNKDGSLRGVRPPTMTAEERAEKESRDRAAAEAKAAQSDAERRDRNLMARFPTEAAHRRAREASLDPVRLAAKSTEARLRELAAERKPLLEEAEFYQGRPLPPKLRTAMDANDAAMEAQKQSVAGQDAEIDRINKNYDAELARLRALWSGAAPGSLGPRATVEPPHAARAASKPN